MDKTTNQQKIIGEEYRDSYAHALSVFLNTPQLSDRIHGILTPRHSVNLDYS